MQGACVVTGAPVVWPAVVKELVVWATVVCALVVWARVVCWATVVGVHGAPQSLGQEAKSVCCVQSNRPRAHSAASWIVDEQSKVVHVGWANPGKHWL